MFDKDGEGSISLDEMAKILHMMNVGTLDSHSNDGITRRGPHARRDRVLGSGKHNQGTDMDEVRRVLANLDSNNKGGVAFNEFFVWFVTQQAKIERQSIETYAHSLFEMVDRDHSGTVTASEFALAVKKMGDYTGQGVTEDDIHMLIREIDEDEDNMINEEEFADLLKQCI